MIRLLCGDAIDLARTLPDESIHCIVTSPPYWGLRDYGHPGQIGLESTPDEYVAKLVALFAELRRALRDDGTLWLNLGDCYATVGGAGWQGKNGQRADRRFTQKTLKAATKRSGPRRGKRSDFSDDRAERRDVEHKIVDGLKPKDLVGIPWRVAFALQADGWWLRSDIIWSKPNPMPESVTDRPTKAHEYVFLLAKSERYYFDQDAVREKWADARCGDPGPARSSITDSLAAGSRRYDHPTKPRQASLTGGSYHPPGQTPHSNARRSGNKERSFEYNGGKYGVGHSVPWEDDGSGRNLRSVWQITTKPFPEAHFATFPPELAERCIKAATSEKGACGTCGGALRSHPRADECGQELRRGEVRGEKRSGARHQLRRRLFMPDLQDEGMEAPVRPRRRGAPVRGARPVRRSRDRRPRR
ncbi:MAG: site-specific DNA-methyltransferase [Actinobacteria bacterium]|nr:site-specific DNA-methyltransferase [Actinomycetota bacterium]